MAKARPIKLLTLDTETYNGLIGGLKRIAVYDGESVTYGYTFEDIEPILINYYNKGFKPIVYIHNLEFDARKIPCIFDDSRIKWSQCFVINGKLARITCKKYSFQDSFKILPMSLRKLSNDFDVEHGKLDLWEEVKKKYGEEYHDIVDYLDRCNVDDELYLKYLGYDVISLYEIVEKLIEVSGLTLQEFVKCITTASLSRHIFKNGYKGKPFKNPHNFKTDFQMLSMHDFSNDLETEEFLRCSYCGGRTEVFKILLEKKAYHYDVNSLYPYVCYNYDYPIGRPTFYSTEESAERYFLNWMKDHEGLGFLCCEIFIPMQNIPPLPVKMGKLAFPCGYVWGTWTFEELEYAILECGCKIMKYHEVCAFTRTYPVFKNFIDTFSKMKEEADINGNLSLRTFSKLLQNVAYGYTGMRRDNKSTLDSIKNIDKYDSDEILGINTELGFIEVKQLVKSRYIQVQVASYVTSRARLVLLKALRNADKLGTVYYCDTDSIVTDVLLPNDMVDAHKLGYFKLESTPLKGVFLQPKVYAEVFETDEEKAKETIENDYNLRNNFLKEDNHIYKVEKKFKGCSSQRRRLRARR